MKSGPKTIEGKNKALKKLAEHAFKLRLSNEEVFVDNSTYSGGHIKKRIIQQELFPYECFSCGNTGEWNGQKLVLQLEHKNGKRNDHRLENLCFLCPNCHSQSSTYAGKNLKNDNRTRKAYYKHVLVNDQS